jgi:hypothetical protein
MMGEKISIKIHKMQYFVVLKVRVELFYETFGTHDWRKYFREKIRFHIIFLQNNLRNAKTYFDSLRIDFPFDSWRFPNCIQSIARQIQLSPVACSQKNPQTVETCTQIKVR